MELLLKSGADVKCLDERGDTPLHAAVKVDSEAIVVVRLLFFLKNYELVLKPPYGHFLSVLQDSELISLRSCSRWSNFVLFFGTEILLRTQPRRIMKY